MRKYHYLSSDNDPLFQFNQWKANLRILDIEKIKSVPPHSFIERFIGTVDANYWSKLYFGMPMTYKIS